MRHTTFLGIHLQTWGLTCRPAFLRMTCRPGVRFVCQVYVCCPTAHITAGPAEKVGDDRSGLPGDEVAGSPNSYVALAALYAILALPAAVAPHTVSCSVFLFKGVQPKVVIRM